ncbi:hypothetical protein L6261_01915 [Candidatus Parcubacteria bacterium]|nr:hypothetical protein [Candidatus Parcubacteria bacterium]
MINIIAVFISPVVATIVALWVGEKMRKRNYQDNAEDEVLRKLIAARHQMISSDFLSAINSINLVFHKNLKIKELVKNLYRAYRNKEDQGIVGQRIVELIYEICKHKHYKVTENEINNFFIPNKISLASEKNINNEVGNNSTSNIISQKVDIESKTKNSLTVGNLNY